jgi:hypothetical protein
VRPGLAKNVVVHRPQHSGRRPSSLIRSSLVRWLVVWAFLALTTTAAEAQRRRRKRSRPAPAPAPAATAPKPPARGDDARGDDAPSPPPPGDDAPAGKPGKAKVFDFTGLDISGRLRAPQLLYFLERANEELERASLERRSFIPEMMRTLDEEAL